MMEVSAGEVKIESGEVSVLQHRRWDELWDWLLSESPPPEKKEKQPGRTVEDEIWDKIKIKEKGE
uniref:Uncharacterized protein n=1 Tax=viral metagenome TaxID=1070528 RepID=A0A6M3IMF1_9ZZZZ